MSGYVDIKTLIEKREDILEKKNIYQLQFLERKNKTDFYILTDLGKTDKLMIHKIVSFRFKDYVCDVVSHTLTDDWNEKNDEINMISILFSKKDKVTHILNMVLNIKNIKKGVPITGELNIVLKCIKDKKPYRKIIEKNIKYPEDNEIIYTLISYLSNEQVVKELN